jgi:hypothetical protein
MTPAFAQLDRIRKLHTADYGAEDVTFRGADVDVILNRRPTINWKDGSDGNGKAKVVLLPSGNATITLGRDQLDEDADVPKKGENFVRGATSRFRIQDIDVRETSWLCLCQESPIE